MFVVTTLTSPSPWCVPVTSQLAHPSTRCVDWRGNAHTRVRPSPAGSREFGSHSTSAAANVVSARHAPSYAGERCTAAGALLVRASSASVLPTGCMGMRRSRCAFEVCARTS